MRWLTLPLTLRAVRVPCSLGNGQRTSPNRRWLTLPLMLRTAHVPRHLGNGCHPTCTGLHCLEPTLEPIFIPKNEHKSKLSFAR
ncbi:hypothetical protein NDU88_005562 [Pleurodeles waltl]|uniref:Secreted protein n=1 Tax=Pleurodeles waltl TaxID=8319 RepID=A0AAV7UKH6_PLEWA|nr:hypothetical protein NDU88_005562 [Pleurodeles waltl]